MRHSGIRYSCLRTCLSMCVHMSTYMSARMSAHMSIHMSAHMSIHMFIHACGTCLCHILGTCAPMRFPAYMPAHPSTHIPASGCVKRCVDAHLYSHSTYVYIHTFNTRIASDGCKNVSCAQKVTQPSQLSLSHTCTKCYVTSNPDRHEHISVHIGQGMNTSLHT